MIRSRFKANHDDYRPVNWPEAHDIESTTEEGYIFTDRFPKPEWFNAEQATQQPNL